jgi:hypothetical protein
MDELYKELIANQLAAALSMLSASIDRCPAEIWNEGAPGSAFCQVAFHALFYADFYLEQGEAPELLRAQPFHQANVELFADYEELEPRAPVRLYTQADIQRYVQHCREKAARVIAAETGATLAAPTGFGWLKFSRAELYVYSIRHLQDHAAELSGRVQRASGQESPWAKSGWRDH